MPRLYCSAMLSNDPWELHEICAAVVVVLHKHSENGSAGGSVTDMWVFFIMVDGDNTLVVTTLGYRYCVL